MPPVTRQILIYLAVGAVLVLVGLNSIRGEKTEKSVFPAGAAGTSASGDAAGSGEEGFAISGGGRKLIVDVAGAVHRPGVYRFSHGARVIDAIDRAGGITGKAVIGGINRAATLTDGQQVVVPSSAGGRATAGVCLSGSASSPPAPISLGTATQQQLEEIDGIGPVTAQKILEFRDAQGGLGSIDELDQISGIGPVTMESLRAALTP